MRKHIAAAFLPFLVGCTSNASVSQAIYDSSFQYGTVSAIDNNQLTISLNDDSSSQITIALSDDIPILKDTHTIPYEEILQDDELLLTYTNGQLSVVEVCDWPQADSKQ